MLVSEPDIKERLRKIQERDEGKMQGRSGERKEIRHRWHFIKL